MANLKDVIYLSNEDYETLVSTGTVTIAGETLIYNEDNVYITPEKLASTSEDGLMSSSDKIKLNGIESGAEVNVQSDWNAVSGDAQILNKPTTISGYGITDAYTKTETNSQITSAIEALNVPSSGTGAITGFGAGKTLATLTETSGKVSATFQDISIISSQVSDIQDTYSGTDGKAISGKGVKSAIDELTDTLTGTPSASKTITAFDEVGGKISVTFSDIAISESQVTNLTTDLGNKVPTSRKVNNKELSSDITLSASDIGLGNVDNTSDSSKKTAFTGEIAENNTGFVTGGDAYTALSHKQDSLISGTNIKTINNSSLLGSGNIDVKELFYCTYGTTTYAEITQALSDGKLPVCIYKNREYIYSVNEGGYHYLTNALSNSAYYIRVNTSEVWANSALTLEKTSNKTQSISSSSTDAQYPSAKAVYNYAQPIINSNNKLDADLIDDTNSTNKFVTASDKTKLNGIETGAQVNVIETVKVNGTALTPDANKAVDVLTIEVFDYDKVDDNVKAKFIANPTSIVLRYENGNRMFFYPSENVINNGVIESTFFTRLFCNETPMDTVVENILINWLYKRPDTNYYEYEFYSYSTAIVDKYATGIRKILSNLSGNQVDLNLGDLQVSSNTLKETIPATGDDIPFYYNSITSRYEQDCKTSQERANLFEIRIGNPSTDGNIVEFIQWDSSGEDVKNYISIGTDEIDINNTDVKETLDSYLGKYANASASTVLDYMETRYINLASNRTFTLTTAPTGCNPEYKAIITNAGNITRTMTLPSGTIIKSNDPDIIISSNTFKLPAGTTVELNIQNGHAIVYNWEA